MPASDAIRRSVNHLSADFDNMLALKALYSQLIEFDALHMYREPGMPLDAHHEAGNKSITPMFNTVVTPYGGFFNLHNNAHPNKLVSVQIA